MSTLHLIGWRRGLQTVPLVHAVMRHSTGSLVQAKRLVEQLLEDEDVTLVFPDEDAMRTFGAIAEEYGCIVRYGAGEQA